MPSIKDFEDIEIWKLSRIFNKDISVVLTRLNHSKSFELARQLERAAGSIMDNVAEGFDRDGNKEFIQFLVIAKASASEVRSQLYRAYDRELIRREELDKFQNDCRRISGQIGRFIAYLKDSSFKGKKFVRKDSDQVREEPLDYRMIE